MIKEKSIKSSVIKPGINIKTIEINIKDKQKPIQKEHQQEKSHEEKPHVPKKLHRKEKTEEDKKAHYDDKNE